MELLDPVFWDEPAGWSDAVSSCTPEGAPLAPSLIAVLPDLYQEFF